MQGTSGGGEEETEMTAPRIKAYHRVSSNDVLQIITDLGVILPAAYRMDPDQARQLCRAELNKRNPPAAVRLGIDRLLDERVEEIAALQEREWIRPPKTEGGSMFMCDDLLSGDFMNIFLTPGGFTGAMIARGWPLSGFEFDAEELIRRGAQYRKEDFLWGYKSALLKALESSSGPDTYATLKADLAAVQTRAKYGDEAVEELAIFDVPGHDPTTHGEYAWPSSAEVVWPGPLPLELATAVWHNGKILETVA